MIKIVAHKAETTVTITTPVDVTYGVMLALINQGFTDIEIAKVVVEGR